MKFSLLSYKMPYIGGTQYGCFSRIPKHPPSEGKVLYRTTYMDGFCKRFEEKNFQPLSGNILSCYNVYSGMESNHEPKNKKFVISKLTSENYNESSERKYNTEIQRTWINYKDPSIAYISTYKKPSARAPWENQIKYMSLPFVSPNNKRLSYGKKVSDITKKKLEEMSRERKIRERE